MNNFTRSCSLVIAGFFFAFSGYAQTKYFVKANASGANNGTTWTNAFIDLQSALDVAVSGDQIWVATGTYKPSKDQAGSATPSNPRTKVFILNSGVKLYGGFTGTETSLTERNIAQNLTILSGDRQGDDAAGFANMSDNCYHVVAVNRPDAPTVLDGVTVTGGNSDNGVFEELFLGQNFGYLYGGGIFTVEGTNFTLSNCIVKGNSAYHGGGMLNRRTAPTVTNCVFTKNKATRAGGAIFFENLMSAVPVVTNTVMEGNVANELGSAIFNRNSNPVIKSTTIYNNTVATNGGAIYNEAPSNPTIVNSIIYKNAGGIPLQNQAGASATVNYTNIEVGWIGTGNIDKDPIFNKPGDPDGPDNLWRTLDDGLHLRVISTSANVGSGNDAVGIDTDIAGFARVQNGGVNMGAYETLKSVVQYFVSQNANGANHGLSWANAFTSLQSALEAAENGDQIWVAKGTYIPSKDDAGNASPSNARKKAFILKNGVKLYGGFAGNETTVEQRNLALNRTILSGDLNNNDQDGFVNMSDNCYHVIAVDHPDSPTVLDGVTVKGGNSDNGVFEELFLGEYFGFLYGGGIFTIYGSNFTLSNAVVTGNVAYHGGGLLARGTAPKVINCVFTKNKATRAGGAIFFENSMSAIPVVTNTVIENNIANSIGGGIFNRHSNTLMVNNTIVNNTATTNGGAIYNESPSSPSIQNTIVWGNTGGTVINNESGAAATISFSLIQGGYTGTGNISLDPMFVETANGDGIDDIWMTTDDGLSLKSGSPAVDGGLNAAIIGGIMTDITGDTRIINGKVNIGAYERVKQLLTVSLTTPSNAVYNGNAHTASASTSPVNVTTSVVYKQNGQVVTAPLNAGEYEVTAFVTDINYAGYATATFEISKADQTVSLTGPETVYVNDQVELTTSATSGLPVTLVSSDVHAAVIDGKILYALAEGEVTVTATQEGNDNYNDASAEIVVSVIKKDQTISLEAPATAFVGDSFELAASVSSELTLTFASSDESIAVIDGNMVTLIGAGEVTITASQDGNSEYNAASAEVTFVVAKKTQTISFEALEDRILGEKPFELSATASSGLEVSFSSSDPEVATIEGNVVTLVGSGETTITAYQEGDEFYETAEAVEHKLTVILVMSAENPNGTSVKVYPNPTVNYVVVEGADSRVSNPVALIDHSGRGLNAKTASVTGGMQLDLTHLPAGIYYVKAVTRDGVTITKVVKK